MYKFYKFTDNEHNQTTLTPFTHGYVDGYSFGDRLLEGVIFKIYVDQKGKLRAQVHPDSAKYFSKLNTKKWLKEAVEFAKCNDLFQSDPEENEDDVILYNHSKPFNEQQAYFEFEPTFKESDDVQEQDRI